MTIGTKRRRGVARLSSGNSPRRLARVYDLMSDRTDGVIALPADLTEWLIAKAMAEHGGDYGDALEHVLRQAKATQDGAALAQHQVDKPADPWATVTAAARERHHRPPAAGRRQGSRPQWFPGGP